MAPLHFRQCFTRHLIMMIPSLHLRSAVSLAVIPSGVLDISESSTVLPVVADIPAINLACTDSEALQLEPIRIRRYGSLV